VLAACGRDADLRAAHLVLSRLAVYGNLAARKWIDAARVNRP